jgi:hypothetical protein
MSQGQKHYISTASEKLEGHKLGLKTNTHYVFQYNFFSSQVQHHSINTESIIVTFQVQWNLSIKDKCCYELRGVLITEVKLSRNCKFVTEICCPQ